MIGLPGTGLGGIFYILLVIWMIVREVWLLLRGASGSSRWRKIAKLTALAAAIVASLWLEGWLLYELFASTGWLNSSPYGEAAGSYELAVAALIPMLSIAPFVILAVLVLSIHTLRLALRRPQAVVAQV